MSNPIHILNQTRRQYGWSAAFRLFVDRLGARLFQRHVMEVVWLDLQRAEACSPVEGFEFRFLSADEVQAFSNDPSLDLDVQMVTEVKRGDRLELPDDVAYMFKGFTHPTYRGRRLHAAAMALALTELGHRGVRGLISTVEWTNEASLRSCDRLGYERLGRIAQSGPFNRRRVSIPAEIATKRGVKFIPAHAWNSDLAFAGC